MDLSVLLWLASGLLAGIRHAFEPDHVAAVSALVVREPNSRMALRLGLAWGAGHGLVLLAVFGVVSLGLSFLPESLEGWPDRIVGGVLILLGAVVLHNVLSGRWHAHMHDHDDGHAHAHPHPHIEEPRLERRGFFDLQGTFRYLHSCALTPPQGAGIAAHCAVHGVSEIHEHGHGYAILSLGRSVGMGMLHGLAGSGLLVAVAWSAAPSALHRWMTICLYVAGAMGAMGAMTYAVGRTLRAVPPPVERLLRIASGVASVIVGMTLLT